MTASEPTLPSAASAGHGSYQGISCRPCRWSTTGEFDPDVWSGRASQENSSIWCFTVLHQCIRPLIGACCAPGHHGYQRACVLISGQASNGAKRVTRVRMRREDRSSISSHPLADLGGKPGTIRECTASHSQGAMTAQSPSKFGGCDGKISNYCGGMELHGAASIGRAPRF